jgi:hypothetical protein
MRCSVPVAESINQRITLKRDSSTAQADIRFANARESRPDWLGSVNLSGMQETRMTGGGGDESGGFLEFEFGGVAARSSDWWLVVSG